MVVPQTDENTEKETLSTASKWSIAEKRVDGEWGKRGFRRREAGSELEVPPGALLTQNLPDYPKGVTRNISLPLAKSQLCSFRKAASRLAKNISG